MSSEATSEFDLWIVSVQPVINSLVAELGLTETISERGPESVLAFSDQFRMVSQHTLEWVSAHRCPIADIDTLLTKMARSYGLAADLLEAEAKNPNGSDWLAINRELTGLRKILANFWTLIAERSEGWLFE